MTLVTNIYGLVDPRTNEIRYVGKANNPRNRLQNHLTPQFLRPKTVKNSWLKSLLKAGLKPSLIILETVPVEDWEAAERRWIANLPALVNGTSGGDGMHDPSPEIRAKMGIHSRGHIPWNKGKRYHLPTPLIPRPPHRGYWRDGRIPWAFISAGAAALRGKPSWNKGRPWSAEKRAKHNREYVVTDHSGVEYKVRGLKEFCALHGLQSSIMCHVASGARLHHRGWKCLRLDDRLLGANRNKNAKRWIVIDSDGAATSILNLAAFCRSNGLDHGAMSRMAKGERPGPHRGWFCSQA